MSTTREYKNKTSYNRADHSKDSKPYRCISSAIYQDENLNAIENGIMLYLLSNADSFIVNKKNVFKWSGLGRVSFNKSWKKLISLGYINKENIQGGIHWTINEDPLNLTMSESCSNENLTMTGFGSTESGSTGSGSTGNDPLTSNKIKLVLKKTNTKNKLPSLDSEGKSDPGSKDLPPKKSYSYGGLAQQLRDYLGVSRKPFNGFDKDVSGDELKPVDSPQKKDKADPFDEWYDSYPSRGIGQIKGKKTIAKKRFMKISDTEREDLILATKLLKSNVPDDPKYYAQAENFIQKYQDTLDAYPVYENRNIDDGSGSFSV